MQGPAEHQVPKLVAVPPGRVPPYSLDAERSVLGGILLDNVQLDELRERLRPEHFYREAHRKIFEAMILLHEKREPIDRVTVKDALREMGALEAVGGEGFIDLLDTVVPSASSLLYYGTIVQEKAIARRIIEAAHTIASEGYEQRGPVDELIDTAESRMLAACEVGGAGEGPTLTKQAIKDVFKQLERDHEIGGELTGLASGFPGLDDLTSGFQPGNLVILAARPSLGKTALVLQWLLHVALRLNFATLLFELEMTKAELIKRGAAQEELLDSDRLRKPKLMRDGDWAKLAKFGGSLADSAFYIDDQTGLSSVEIRARARRVYSKCSGTERPLKIIAVDHAQLMGGEGKNDEERISKNSRELKKLAKELGVAVVLLSQLNRELEKRSDPRPKLSDLRGSGSLEQDGDLIVFLHRTKDGEEFIIGKQRNGPLGIVNVTWNGKFTRFESSREDDAKARQPSLFDRGDPPPPTDEDRRFP